MTNSKYPWDKWFKRKKFVLYWGQDFDCMTHSMNVQIRQAADARGVSVSIQTNIEDSGVTSLSVEVR